jgi:stage II sporulation protein GA (sporulation sigma-E factor processing peptidase)
VAKPVIPVVPVIYIDIVFLINLVMDAVLLAMTAWVTKRPIRWRRLMLGAVIGAIYSLVLFVPPLDWMTSWPGKAIASLIMVWVGVGRKHWLDLARNCLALYFVAFVLAGAALALHFAIPGVSLTSGTVITSRGIEFGTSGATLGVLVAIPVAFALISHITRRVRDVRRLEGSLLKVSIKVADKTYPCTALVDTGNSLFDPVSRLPVSFVDLAVVSDSLPSSLVTALTSGQDPVAALYALDLDDRSLRFALIPFRGAGKGQSMALAILPSNISVELNSAWTETASRSWLALSPQPLSRDGRFQAILHPHLILGDDSLEDVSAKSAGRTQTSPSPSSTLGAGPGQTPGRSG